MVAEREPVHVFPLPNGETVCYQCGNLPPVFVVVAEHWHRFVCRRCAVLDFGADWVARANAVAQGGSGGDA